MIWMTYIGTRLAKRIFHPNTGAANRIIHHNNIYVYIYFDFARLPLPVKSIILLLLLYLSHST